MFNNLEINNNVKIEELYDGKTWIHGISNENICITVFIITISSEQLKYSLETINTIDQDISFVVNCIKDISPTTKAYNEMRERCKTKYFIQNDEDMELYFNCLKIIINTININNNEKTFLHTFKLIDDKLGLGTPPIIDCLKIYNQDIMTNYPIINNDNSTSSVDFMWHQKIMMDGYLVNNTNVIIGYHGKHRSNFDILLRYCKIIKSLINPSIKTNSSHICKFLRPLFKENEVNMLIKKILFLFSKIKNIDYCILNNIINKLNMYVDKNKLITYEINNRIAIQHITEQNLIVCDKECIKNINEDCLMTLISIGCICTNSYEYSYDKYPYDIYKFFIK